ncbi:hypothetical protein [Halorhabdus rudnickae]|uniref:hypothetical protein n=1 Tax=Halorhabdus rudnickae TaxID=1775544 RepID=UPI001083EE5B|nr:hypothetical protein [Halorhabdus rudnickae]
MARASLGSRGIDPDGENGPTTSIETWLKEVSKALNPTESEDLSELGIYSVHEHDSARTITLPQGASEFDDVTTVKQYYFEGEEIPLLLIAPIKI